MKKIFTIKFVLASVFCVLLVPSCNVLDQPYKMGIDADDAFSTPDNIRLAAVGMYNAMQNRTFLAGHAQIYVDVRSMDTNPTSYFAGASNFNPTAATIQMNDAWTGAYRTIFEVNTFLERIAENTGLVSATEEKQFIAEAKFIRAVTYFYLLNLWGDQYTKDGTGLGVPLVLRSFDGVSVFSGEAKIPRSSVTDVYTQIIKDLNEALPGLPIKTSPEYDYLARATQGAVYAMLSRIYLYLGQYDEVVKYADLVTGYSLDASLKNSVFAADPIPADSDEIIFFLAHSASDNPNTNHSLGQHYGRTKRADITVSQNFIDNFDDITNDKRYTELIYQAGTAPNFTYWNQKYIAASNADWAPIIRYAEVLLNKAEALAKDAASGVDGTALGIINDIRDRSGAAQKLASDFADKDAFVEYILAERRRELGFEGHGSFDLFRNGKGIDAGRGGAATPAMTYPDNLFAFPIPEADMIKAEGILKQNPGY